MAFVAAWVPGDGDDIQVAAIKGDTARVEKLIRYNKSFATEKIYHGYTPLHWAAMGGHTKIAEMLIANGADVNATSKENVTPIFLAAQKGHKDIVELLLKHGAKTDIVANYTGMPRGRFYVYNGYHCTPLFAAAEGGHADTVELLLRSGANVNWVDGSRSNVALYAAMYGGNRQVFEVLARHGVNLKAENDELLFPLGCTIDHAIADFLLSRGADPNRALYEGGRPLHRASTWGNVKIVQVLLNYGANPNTRDKDECTPLHCAANCRDDAYSNKSPYEIIELLIAHGADVNAKDVCGNTPLDTAAIAGRFDIVNLLRKHGGKPSGGKYQIFAAIRQNDVKQVQSLLESNHSLINGACFGMTPLHFAANYGKTDIAKILIEKGADILESADYYETPIESAVVGGNVDTVKLFLSKLGKRPLPGKCIFSANNVAVAKLLLAHGPTINNLDETGETPLTCAARRGYKDLAKFYIAQGADVNRRREGCQSVLLNILTWREVEAKTSPMDMAELLIDHGADVNATEVSGCTILHMLAMYPDPDAVKFLLKHGADVNSMDDLSETPLQKAKDPETIRTLLLYGGTIGHKPQESWWSRMVEGLHRIWHP